MVKKIVSARFANPICLPGVHDEWPSIHPALAAQAEFDFETGLMRVEATTRDGMQSVLYVTRENISQMQFADEVESGKTNTRGKSSRTNPLT